MVLSGFIRLSMRHVGTTSSRLPSAPTLSTAAVLGSTFGGLEPSSIQTPLVTYSTSLTSASRAPPTASSPVKTEGSTATSVCVPSASILTIREVSP